MIFRSKKESHDEASETCRIDWKNIKDGAQGTGEHALPRGQASWLARRFNELNPKYRHSVHCSPSNQSGDKQ